MTKVLINHTVNYDLFQYLKIILHCLGPSTLECIMDAVFPLSFEQHILADNSFKTSTDTTTLIANFELYHHSDTNILTANFSTR